MTNKQIAKSLQEVADLLELTGGNPFRARAFANAARVLQRLPEQIKDLAAAGQLTGVQGIGSGLGKDIEVLLDTGSLPQREELVAKLPAGLPELLNIKGLGVKKVRSLWQSLGITSVGELAVAARENRLLHAEGFGKKTQEQLLESIERLASYRAQRRYATVYRQLMPLLQTLKQQVSIEDCVVVGAFRRKMPTISELTVLIQAQSEEVIAPAFEAIGVSVQQINTGVWQFSLEDGFGVEVVWVPEVAFGTECLRRTGPESFVEAIAQKIGGLPEVAAETELFQKAGLAFVSPELRDLASAMSWAETNTLPKLIEVSDLRGTLHNHSTYSDGAHSLVEMAETARHLGLEYYGACDHSRSLTVANGMSIERVLEQQAEIASRNAVYAATGTNFRIFSGIESDILNDGSLDYPDEVLASFDLVVASIHNGFNMTEAVATQRLITAIENPYTTILGHPTGRLLLAREGYPVHHHKIIDACAANGVALELNANPYRLDLDWTWVPYALEKGVFIAINPDAHAMEGLQDVFWGVEVARKAGLTVGLCLNAMDRFAFEQWLRLKNQ
ncbi:MAG: DNA polymerase/3'-5' exonuclease PolX [Bacteroidetes Order II. Incertae sedis bacterium]|nr:DNA polymerase/3'-5' exonuclease PolX [Bacteroidetes Order II. bacterium]